MKNKDLPALQVFNSLLFLFPNRVLPCDVDYELGPFKLTLHRGYTKSAGIILNPVFDSNLKCLNCHHKTTREHWQIMCSENNKKLFTHHTLLIITTLFHLNLKGGSPRLVSMGGRKREMKKTYEIKYEEYEQL